MWIEISGHAHQQAAGDLENGIGSRLKSLEYLGGTCGTGGRIGTSEALARENKRPIVSLEDLVSVSGLPEVLLCLLGQGVVLCG